jgi:peptidoglycan/xylan/chitin deacetylase (PgdA/CDA1 family)
MVQTTVALRVDVDTRRGLDEGVPQLLELFRATGVRASFFVTMGPDRSGMAIRRAWRPSFLWKMWRTNPLRLYGVRTLLSGTILRPRDVGAGAPELLRQIAGEGHEIAPHGYDHVGWQDRVHRLSASLIRADMAQAVSAFERIFGVLPHASAAPGWRTTSEALRIQEEFGFRYASDVRGVTPFRPWITGGPLNTLQLPTTMPTIDELLGQSHDLVGRLLAALRPGLNVFTLHAEVEGGPLLPVFREFLDRVRRTGVRLTRLLEVTEQAPALLASLPLVSVSRGWVTGRSGWVATQTAWA